LPGPEAKVVCRKEAQESEGAAGSKGANRRAEIKGGAGVLKLGLCRFGFWGCGVQSFKASKAGPKKTRGDEKREKYSVSAAPSSFCSFNFQPFASPSAYPSLAFSRGLPCLPSLPPSRSSPVSLSPALSPSLPFFRLVSPLDDPHWDTAIGRLPGVTFFHSAAWARVLHSTYGFKLSYFVAGEPGYYRTVLPMAEVDSWLSGRRGVALPFSDVCGPLTSDPNSVECLFQSVSDYARQHRWKYWEVRGGRSFFPEATASVSFWAHALSLTSDPATLFARFDSATRRAVRKAEKSNLTIEFSQSLDGVREFHDLLCLTRRRHGLPPQPFRFFEKIQREVLAKNLGVVVLARLPMAAASRSGRAVAGAVFFESFGRALYKFGASDESFQQLRGNNLVMSQAIAHYARRGFASLDFGRTSRSNEGLRQFKLGWGTAETSLDYVRYDLRRQSYVMTPDQTSGWHTRIFQRLPAFASRFLGEVLYRHMA
jgi:hypothetical protein